jgi:hypothetical protein
LMVFQSLQTQMKIMLVKQTQILILALAAKFI